MGVIELGLRLVVSAVCAGLGQFITGYSRGGCPVSLLAAFAGTFLGPWAAGQLGWPEPFLLPVADVEFPVVTAAAGAVVLVIVVNLATAKRKF